MFTLHVTKYYLHFKETFLLKVLCILPRLSAKGKPNTASNTATMEKLRDANPIKHCRVGIELLYRQLHGLAQA